MADALADLFDDCGVHCPEDAVATLQEIMDEGRAVATPGAFRGWYEKASAMFSSLRRKVWFDYSCPVQTDISRSIDVFLDGADPDARVFRVTALGVDICEKIFLLVYGVKGLDGPP